ncbi:MAG: phosphatase PAP2 family protein [Solirubrobacteraceae bacterium]
MRARRSIRAAAWSLVVVGVAAPLVRRRVKLPPAAVLGAAAAAPVALCVVAPRSKLRDVAVCGLQMWAYIAAYELPHDDPERLASRVRVGYPIAVDRVLGLGVPPTLRLQRRFATPGEIGDFERALVWCHWLWFLVPHGSVGYVLLRRPERFASAASRMYAVFDLGASVYWFVPTAPPWWAAKHGHLDDGGVGGDVLVRRMMIEYGERFWGERWGALYDVLGGNPLAAMPSLHFATSVMAAHLLSEVGPVAGALGWTYAGTLGLALVYLGEHYAADLLAGVALAEGVRHAAPRAEPAARAVAGLLGRVQRYVAASPPRELGQGG